MPKRGKQLPRFALPGTLKVKTAVKRGEVVSQNIAGIFEGSDPKLKDQYVVLSAHVDHLGVGKPINGDAIFNGAMDNAAGVATMLDIAADLKASGAKTKRSILFVAVTGEEKGDLGSDYFARHPTVPLKGMVADINTDMFLPLYPLKLLTVPGLEESTLGDDIRWVAQQMGVAGSARSGARAQHLHPQRSVQLCEAGRAGNLSGLWQREGLEGRGYREQVAAGALSRAFGRSESTGRQVSRGRIQPAD